MPNLTAMVTLGVDYGTSTQGASMARTLDIGRSLTSVKPLIYRGEELKCSRKLCRGIWGLYALTIRLKKANEILLQKPRARIGLYGSYASALSLNELHKLASSTNTTLLDPDLALTYGTTLGSVRLRERIAELHSSPEVELTAANVVITPGSSMANHLVLATLCGPGDHIICGLTVASNPNNPTGTVILRDILEQVLALAQKDNIVVFSDEVFSPLFHTKDQAPPLVSLGSPRTLSTSSLSKAYALPGIRIGWVVSQDKEIIHRVSALRDYTTISV
ncbi:hypothetical protein FOXB_15258 [Fusarium oxysporum f. sp. conglutinans Fo5176]|uniref:Aminotransferase class I/classII large domain-containing protein n=1 Tax=Fusarium oxysporum (strain Fo5176) TaxID=660025 RepID=F9G9C6_FUSOF|nr:hypothetical protein FOXB_15258 [Fusarium oxysporum f. sp. conglutinans Fo5176]